jgi:hypothetical protein
VASIRLKFVKAYVDRHGKTRHYFRKPGCKSVALPGLVGSDEFMAAYAAAAANTPRVEVAARQTRAGSISAMVIGYLGSADFHNLAPASQHQYRRILEGLRRDCGELGMATLARKHVVRMLDARAETPVAARDFLRCLRLLVRYAISIGVRQDDPTAGVRVKMPKSDGFHTWTDEEIAAFKSSYPIGTRPRLALELLLNIAARCADVVRVGRGNVRNGVLHLPPQQKTGTPLVIPITAELADARASTSRSSSTSAGVVSPPRRSGHGSPSGASASASRAARRTGCARRPAGDSPRLGAAPTRSPPSVATRASTRWPAIPARPTRRAWQGTPWPGPKWQHRVSNLAAESV